MNRFNKMAQRKAVRKERSMLEQVLTTYVRPLLQSHGGDMEVISYEDGILRFRMKGSCAGCAKPSGMR